MKKFSRLSVVVLATSVGALTVAGLLYVDGDANAASYVTSNAVDSATDAVDFNPGDGVCDIDDSVGDGPCTLRAAIQEANAQGAGPHEISLPDSSLYIELSIDGAGEDQAVTGDLDVTTDITIQGAEPDNGIMPVVDKNTMDDRVFHILPTGSLTVRNFSTRANSDSPALNADGTGFYNEGNLEIQREGGGPDFDWLVAENFNSLGSGGTIFNSENATLLIDNGDKPMSKMIIDASVAELGGAIFNAGTATISGTFDPATSNTGGVHLTNSRADYGGAIHNSAELTLSCSVELRYNKSAYAGGGLFNASDATAEVISSSLLENGSDSGGGVHNDGELSISTDSSCDKGSTTGNTALNGGGIANSGNLELDNTTISENFATIDGGGIYQVQVGESPLTSMIGVVEFTNNTADAGAAVHIRDGVLANLPDAQGDQLALFEYNGASDGGAMYITGSDTVVTLEKAYFDYNQSDFGGAVRIEDGEGHFSRTYFSDNYANRSGGAVSAAGVGEIETINTMFYNNTSLDGGAIHADGTDTRVEIIHTTFNHNRAPMIVATDSGTIQLRRSLLINDDLPYCTGTIGADDRNVFADASCSNGPTDVVDDDAMEFDWDSHSVIPRLGNPAIDLIEICPQTEDYEGSTRPVNGDENPEVGCDAGAWEAPEYNHYTFSGTLATTAGTDLGYICVLVIQPDGDMIGVNIAGQDGSFAVAVRADLEFALGFVPCLESGDAVDESSAIVAEWYEDILFDTSFEDTTPPDGALTFVSTEDVAGLTVCLTESASATTGCDSESPTETTAPSTTSTTTTLTLSPAPDDTTPVDDAELDDELSSVDVQGEGTSRGLSSPLPLAFTGSSALDLVLIGSAVLLAGAVVLMTSRKRRKS